MSSRCCRHVLRNLGSGLGFVLCSKILCLVCSYVQVTFLYFPEFEKMPRHFERSLIFWKLIVIHNPTKSSLNIYHPILWREINDDDLIIFFAWLISFSYFLHVYRFQPIQNNGLSALIHEILVSHPISYKIITFDHLSPLFWFLYFYYLCCCVMLFCSFRFSSYWAGLSRKKINYYWKKMTYPSYRNLFIIPLLNFLFIYQLNLLIEIKFKVNLLLF